MGDAPCMCRNAARLAQPSRGDAATRREEPCFSGGTIWRGSPTGGAGLHLCQLYVKRFASRCNQRQLCRVKTWTHRPTGVLDLAARGNWKGFLKVAELACRVGLNTIGRASCRERRGQDGRIMEGGE